jgi:hypothetical protein
MRICQNDMRQSKYGEEKPREMHFSNSHLREDLANLVIYAFFCATHAAFSVFSLLYPEWLEYEYE